MATSLAASENCLWGKTACFRKMVDATAIAILLSGELRTFPTLLPNFEAAVLRPLRPVDTYLHVSLTWTIAAWNNMTALPDPPSHVLPGALALIRERLRPVWERITEVSNAAAHFVFVRWRELYAAMVQHERESQITYGHVLRARPDLVYYCHLDRSWLTRLEAPLLSWDTFIFFRRALAHVILHLASKTFECSTRIELCVPSAIVRLANQSYYDIPANFDLRVASHPQLASIYRHADCPAGLDHCFEHERVRGRSRCSARYCNEPPAAAAAGAAGRSLPACASRSRIQTALHKPIGLRAFRAIFVYHTRGNPWCQCHALTTSTENSMTGPVKDAAGATRYYTSPCLLEPVPRCCKFRGTIHRDVVRDATKLAYPTGCSPWFRPAVWIADNTSTTAPAPRLRALF
jgi:hypothetical protein